MIKFQQVSFSCVIFLTMAPILNAQSKPREVCPVSQEQEVDDSNPAIGTWQVVSILQAITFELPDDSYKITFSKNDFTETRDVKPEWDWTKEDKEKFEKYSESMTVKWTSVKKDVSTFTLYDKSSKDEAKLMGNGIIEVKDDRAIMKIVYADVEVSDLNLPEIRELHMIMQVWTLRKLAEK